MASVNVEVNVLTRASDPTQHQLEEDYTQTFQLTTTDTTYTSDTPAFATTVYNYYNAQLTANTSTSTVANVELRWRAWLGGSTISGGSTTNEGVFGSVSSATDVQNELNSHIAKVVTGDNQTPGQ